jgi:hypothetical protein
MSDSASPRGAYGTYASTPVAIRLNDDLRDLHIATEPRTSGKGKGSYIVVSGGTAANDFVQAFGKDCAFVLPGEIFFPFTELTLVKQAYISFHSIGRRGFIKRDSTVPWRSLNRGYTFSTHPTYTRAREWRYRSC